MGNSQHIDIANQGGADAIKQWLADNSAAILDLSGAWLRGISLKELDLRRVCLREADLLTSINFLYHAL
jgi:uncharacterized protein YjbI with pentapeptide repeats